MIGAGSYSRERSRTSFLKLEVFLVALLMFLIAIPAFGFIARSTGGHIACVRGAFEKTATQTCK
jgi:hypothetical protein